MAPVIKRRIKVAVLSLAPVIKERIKVAVVVGGLVNASSRIKEALSYICNRQTMNESKQEVLA